jgi:deoxyribodipyrimidine photolyase-related protein
VTIGIWVLGDQLWERQAALQSVEQTKAPILLIESLAHAQERRYHAQKLVLVWSAMRHFAEALRVAGWSVTYTQAETFQPALQGWIQQEGITELRLMEPSDRPFRTLIEALDLACEVVFYPNNHFLWSRDAFQDWAGDRQSLRMESFYREGRKRFQVLMDGKDPVGGQWNFDKENRKPPKGKLKTPSPLAFAPDDLTQAVIEKVKTADLQTYGEIEPFRWGVTRTQALQVLETFLKTRLETFGPYQDAMVTGDATLWHALLSPYLNLGLLQPLEVIEAVEQAFWKAEGSLALNSVEGFIRQILGWREYMHGLYHYVEEDYPTRNHFHHTQPLPAFFWDADQTDMNCLHQVLSQIEQTGYAHHIQRLMVLANFALIAGLSPQEVEQWFHAVFIDAYDWVMQPNVIGMGLFADGGLLASKPYAASANYINNMSDYCKNCVYDKGDRTGEKACPFNFFYWDFLDRHRQTLQSQGRMSFILKNLDKMSETERQALRQKAVDWHAQWS